MAGKLQRSDWALLILRIGVGAGLAFGHGYAKLLGGVALWEKLGQAMGHLGITWFPAFWGFMAMAAEFFGGLCILLGILVRPAGALILFTMIMAIVAHATKGQGFSDISHAFEFACGVLCIMIMGSGKISLRGLFGK